MRIIKRKIYSLLFISSLSLSLSLASCTINVNHSTSQPPKESQAPQKPKEEIKKKVNANLKTKKASKKLDKYQCPEFMKSHENRDSGNAGERTKAILEIIDNNTDRALCLTKEIDKQVKDKIAKGLL